MYWAFGRKSLETEHRTAKSSDGRRSEVCESPIHPSLIPSSSASLFMLQSRLSLCFFRNSGNPAKGYALQHPLQLRKSIGKAGLGAARLATSRRAETKFLRPVWRDAAERRNPRIVSWIASA
ncbi:unnamed protein product [Linum trigynum]|uniref:Uncharacterized protein n=1 Tax=Linum trigynum TaxID=586398 RepID=A0AAV2DKE9_9ROSI